MWKSISWRITLIAVLTALSVVVLLTSLTDKVPAGWRDRMPRINLGLDLQGGVFLRLTVEIDKAIENTILRYSDDARAVCREKGLPVLAYQKAGTDGISLKFPPGDFATRAVALLKDEFPSLTVSLGEVKPDGAAVTARLKPQEIQAIRTNAVVQGVETIRNRIDQFGVREPQIVAEGEDRIVVQLPGVKDQQRAIELVGKTALLEFKLVDDGASVEEALKGNVPEDDQVLYQKSVDPQTGRATKTPLVVKKRALLTGDTIKSAKVNFDSRQGGAHVSMSFDSRGAKVFDRVTAENVKRRLAIVLDDSIYSAPVIQERISGGEAQMLAMARALMSAPRLLLIDEPSLGLGPKVVRQIFDLVRDIRAAGTAVLLVE